MPRVTLHPEQREAIAKRRLAETADTDEVERDIDHARAHDLELATILRQIRADAITTRGFAAEDAANDAQTAIRDAWRSIAGSVTKPRRQEMLRDVFDRRVEVLQHELQAHVMRERRAAQRDTADQLRALAQQDAIDAETALGFETNMKTVLDALDRGAEVEGSDPSQTQAAKSRAASAIHAGRIARMLKTGRLTEALALHEAYAGALSSEDAAMLDAAWTDSSTWKATLGDPESAEEALPSFDTDSSDETNWLPPQRDARSATLAADGTSDESSPVILNSSVPEDESKTVPPARFQNAGYEAIDGRQDGKVRRDTDKSYVTINGDMPPFPPISTLQPSRTSSGAFNTVKPELRDYAMRMELSLYANGGAVAYPDAARLLRQFLYATGKTLDVDIYTMIKEISGFRQATESAFEEKVISQINGIIDRNYQDKPLKFSTTPKGWSQFVAGWGSQWRWALGEFNYTFTSTVIVEPRPNGFVLVSVERDIHVFDRYDWNKGQKFKLPNGRVIADDDVARLQITGLGRDFDIRATRRLEPRHYMYKVYTVPEKSKPTI